ncbi:MAG: DegT/DnrJ/EryC1/StrS family aminotransferase, partial [Actinomycetota bacterium]
LGSVFGGKHASTFGDVGALSFNGNKIITTSGGGALVGSAEAMERVRYLATQAKQPTLHYEHTEIGFNYRMSNLLAALGRAQLSRIEPGIARRGELRARYVEALPELGWPKVSPDDRPNNWLSVAMLPEFVDPEDVCFALSRSAIEARPFWKPMHTQPVFADSERIGGGVADGLFERGICLPSGSSMSDADQDRVIEALRVAIADA